MKCDSCGKEVAKVMRVVIMEGYDRISAKPIYNCSECYEKKLKAKKAEKNK